MQQIPLLEVPSQAFPVTPGLALRGKPNSVAITPEVAELLSKNAVVAVGVSGGKDSDACAIAVDRYLNAIDHTGPRCLIHAGLGMVEWGSSLSGCQRQAVGAFGGEEGSRWPYGALGGSLGALRGTLREPGVCKAHPALEHAGDAFLH